MPVLDDATLQEVARLMLSVQMQLESRGYRRQLVRAGIRRARGMAMDKTKFLSPAIYSRGFLDCLKAELVHVQTWLDQERSIAEAPVSAHI